MTTTDFVTCKIMGGLGNQLFQIATALAYGWQHDVPVVFEAIKSSESIFENRPTYWQSLFHQLQTRNTLNINVATTYKHPQFSYSPIPKIPAPVLLEGYFQSYKFFHKYRDQLLKTICLPTQTIADIQTTYHSLLALDNKIGIHIRRGDYLKLKHYHTVLSQTRYYQKALLQFKQCPNLIIFSDDIEWCKKEFKTLTTPWPQKLFKSKVEQYHQKHRCHFVEDTDIVEFFLLSQCNHHIIANSSFSWWAAYLSPKQGNVVAPKKWFGRKTDADSTKDIYLPHWTII